MGSSSNTLTSQYLDLYSNACEIHVHSTIVIPTMTHRYGLSDFQFFKLKRKKEKKGQESNRSLRFLEMEWRRSGKVNEAFYPGLQLMLLVA